MQHRIFLPCLSVANVLLTAAFWCFATNTVAVELSLENIKEGGWQRCGFQPVDCPSGDCIVTGPNSSQQIIGNSATQESVCTSVDNGYQDCLSAAPQPCQSMFYWDNNDQCGPGKANDNVTIKAYNSGCIASRTCTSTE